MPTTNFTTRSRPSCCLPFSDPIGDVVHMPGKCSFCHTLHVRINFPFKTSCLKNASARSRFTSRRMLGHVRAWWPAPLQTPHRFFLPGAPRGFVPFRLEQQTPLYVFKRRLKTAFLSESCLSSLHPSAGSSFGSPVF